MREVQGNLEYEIDNTNKHIASIVYRTLDLVDLTEFLSYYLNLSKIIVNNPFDNLSKNIALVPMVEKICNDVFDAIKMTKSKYGNIIGLTDLANKLYQAFTPYWREGLLLNGKDVIGIFLWHKVLDITNNWEMRNKPISIHKGTIYYFLAQNYLLTGDRDLAFIYLYNAIESDKQLSSLIVGHDHYAEPAYLTATIKDDINNHMYPFISEVRNSLSSYVANYNTDLGTSLSLNEFDKKFLHNKNLEDTVYFFIYNFLYIFSINRNARLDILQNEFSRLRSLDLFFNLCLIIDETLKEAYRCTRGKIHSEHSISDSIIWLVESKGWMRKGGVEGFWGKNYLRLNDTDPDILIPKLLSMSEPFEGKPVKKEVFSLLVAYKLRNYGGHNIHQQGTFTEKYGDILRQLFNALFISAQQL